MRLLSAPFEPGALAPPRGPARAYGQVAGVVALLATAGLALDWVGVAPLGHALASGVVHGGLLALGWLLATEAAPGWIGPVSRLGAALLLASVTARVHPLGALAFLLVPTWLLLEARRVPRLRAIGLGGARSVHALAGLAVGAFLGAHLLVTASRTFGYRLHAGGGPPYLSALAYDAGANALSAEWLFRGAVFSLLWRRWPFWPAALVTTTLSLLRYLLDPALPDAAEARAGAVFYLGLVGLIACALRAWSGSLLPGYLAALAFFAAYRMLAP
jgi:CAAX prenyl protease-like protein